jgi:hypothetical protein
MIKPTALSKVHLTRFTAQDILAVPHAQVFALKLRCSQGIELQGWSQASAFLLFELNFQDGLVGRVQTQSIARPFKELHQGKPHYVWYRNAQCNHREEAYCMAKNTLHRPRAVPGLHAVPPLARV